ncbi:hypothetical protein CH352_00935 [Leptospira hartskeerlii]|uniref:Uncharacterized protein n=1 Tax=Leptospira hartskeerlii TaxID=2023177 RepID=A0A2M9X8N9_9LEPT|nr:hypothetical protein [Leptospira hartskeerlii]PJZ23969.1 hypothetical protein CH357_18515 [Leptospira hartskeerlii]PJZ35233.1 hypothetical protein CH352_00935 [Leptospira hartskeerlii]
MKFIIFQERDSSKDEFINFWKLRYFYDSDVDYEKNLQRPLTKDKIKNLFIWKNGRALSELKNETVERNFSQRLKELPKLDADLSPDKFLEKFSEGGVIWRIFFLHCWQPDRYPVYDQHVYRAMYFIKYSKIEEIPKSDYEKINSYLSEYLPWWEEYFKDYGRDADKALWAFGKKIKAYF